MTDKPQASAGFTANNDDFTFMDHYVDPSWATIDPAQSADETLFAGLSEFTAKDGLFLEPLPFDFSSFMAPSAQESLSISTKDIFSPVQPQPSSAQPLSSGVEAPSLQAFSDSMSPADSHSPSQSASHGDDGKSDSETDDSEEEFTTTKRGAATRSKGANATIRGKRAANKPRPYPRVSDVVRDAPHRLAADGKRQPATTELKGSVRTMDAADDDWRPTMEEYQKMSSKEKRQLRNKISARNFRVRRKG
jgi:hypothetical protein